MELKIEKRDVKKSDIIMEIRKMLINKRMQALY